MALHTKITVMIGEVTLPVIDRFSLTENIGNHASFNIAVEAENFTSESASTSLLENSKNYLGQACVVHLESFDNTQQSTPLRFKGLITHLNGFRDTNDGQIREMVLISGMSSSILLDAGPDMKSYFEQPLSTIVTNTIEGYNQSLLNITVAPETDETLGYSVQANQSNFSYLKHLAATQGEYLLYSEDTLYFGKPDLGEQVALHLGSSLENISLGIETTASNFSYFTHDYFNQAVANTATASAPDASTSGLTYFASNVNDQLYTEPSQVAFSTYEDSQLQQRMDAAVAKQKKANAQGQVTITGTSFNTAVSLGKIISIHNADHSYGTYRVISVDHNCSESGNYSNKFSAIPMEIDVYPNTTINAFNHSETQVAKVVNNVDPDGLSRVQVQFPWQVTNNQSTPWIRVLTPHSGLDKGFHFIPEIEEEVLVGFEGGNAERPFVMGALYTGVNKPEEWQTDANNVKAIRTRSGHTIELNDTEGEEKINIYDNEGSIITFDTQAKSLTINATENIEISAKNIKILAEENIDIQAKGDLNTASEGDTVILSQGSTAVQSTGDVDVTSDGAIAIEAKTEAELKGMNVTVEGKTKANLKGMQTKIEGQMTAVQGAAGKIDVL